MEKFIHRVKNWNCISCLFVIIQGFFSVVFFFLLFTETSTSKFQLAIYMMMSFDYYYQTPLIKALICTRKLNREGFWQQQSQQSNDIIVQMANLTRDSDKQSVCLQRLLHLQSNFDRCACFYCNTVEPPLSGHPPLSSQ